MVSSSRVILSHAATAVHDPNWEYSILPTVPGIPGQYRFFFYSFDCNEPWHVHVQRDRAVCKFWLEPVVLA